MNLHFEHARALTRRHFFKQCQFGVGGMALAALLDRDRPARGADGAG